MLPNIVSKRNKIILVCLFLTVCTVWLGSKYVEINKLNLLQYNWQKNDIMKKLSLTYNGEINYKISFRLPKMNSSDFQMSQISKMFGNLPYILEVISGKVQMTHKNKNGCVQLPILTHIKFSNIYWQVFTMTNMSFNLNVFLYSAYYDNRPILKGKYVVRVIAMISGILLKPKIYCQIWFDEGTRLAISEVSHFLKLGPYGVTYRSFLLSCPIPHNHSDLVPSAVSLMERPCGMATNLLRVVHNVPTGDKKDFAVCVKGLDFPYYDISKYLVEWIEILHILGVDKLFIYEYDVHPNISKVLQYYRALGQVEVIPLTLPGFQPNLYGLLHRYLTQNLSVKRENEKIPYNDCFYMNMYRYKYIAIIDTDEVIMPRKHNTWMQLITNYTYGNPSHYLFRRIISLNSLREEYGWEPTIPKHMYMLQNVYRSHTYDRMSKSILDTSRIIKVGNHYPTLCEGHCRKRKFPTSVAHVWHYRNSCKNKHEFACRKEDVVKDTEMYRFKDELIAVTTRTLSILNLI